MIEKLLMKMQHDLATLQRKPRLIFPEGNNSKIQEVALKLKTQALIEPVLCFRNQEVIPQSLVAAAIETLIIDDSSITGLATQLCKIRKQKLDLITATSLIKEPNYFAMMQLHNNNVDCLLGGIDYSTKDILRPALQIIKTAPDIAIASSANLLIKNETCYVFTDISLNIEPTTAEIVTITKSAIKLANKLGITQPNVALLSFSTNNSAQSASVTKMQAATHILQKTELPALIEGEMQFDSALLPEIRYKKFPESKMQGPANIFVFPNLDAGNIGYKIAEKLGQYHSIGPIILGLKKIVSDLSRGATVTDIYFTAIMTAWRTI